jgi:hypothetical protein
MALITFKHNTEQHNISELKYKRWSWHFTLYSNDYLQHILASETEKNWKTCLKWNPDQKCISDKHNIHLPVIKYTKEVHS